MGQGQQQYPDGGLQPQQPQQSHQGHHAQNGPYGPPAGSRHQPWNMPTQAVAVPAAGRRRRTTMTVVVAVVLGVLLAAALFAAGAVGGLKAVGGEDGGHASPVSSAPPTGQARAGAGEKPTVPGWRTVTNPRTGVVFDVPPEWGRKPASWASYVVEDSDPEEKPLVGFSAPAVLKEKWCVSDADVDGSSDETWLAAAGSRTERGARTPQEAARDNASLWVYGGYAQPDRAKVTEGAAEPYTTASGIRGSVATASSAGVEPEGKCGTDGTSTTFAFKNDKGDIVSWTFTGAKGVDEEVPDATVRKILSTVRLAGG